MTTSGGRVGQVMQRSLELLIAIGMTVWVSEQVPEDWSLSIQRAIDVSIAIVVSVLVVLVSDALTARPSVVVTWERVIPKAPVGERLAGSACAVTLKKKTQSEFFVVTIGYEEVGWISRRIGAWVRSQPTELMLTYVQQGGFNVTIDAAGMCGVRGRSTGQGHYIDLTGSLRPSQAVVKVELQISVHSAQKLGALLLEPRYELLVTKKPVSRFVVPVRSTLTSLSLRAAA